MEKGAFSMLRGKKSQVGSDSVIQGLRAPAHWAWLKLEMTGVQRQREACVSLPV